jgi:hypothetical protein
MRPHLYLPLALTASGVLADGSTRLRPEHGFIGYGISFLQPACAFACRDAISGATLKCSTIMESEEMPGLETSDMVMTDPKCLATDDAFLQTLAWCMSSRCKDVLAWKLEKFWKDNVAGKLADQPDPKETYGRALDEITNSPTTVYAETSPLNKTSVMADDLWFSYFNTYTVMGQQEILQEGFG